MIFLCVCVLLIYLFIYFWLCDASNVEGSQATANQTAVLLRSVISQQRVPQTNQATALVNAVRAVGEKLIAANPVGMLRLSFCFFLLFIVFTLEICILSLLCSMFLSQSRLYFLACLLTDCL